MKKFIQLLFVNFFEPQRCLSFCKFAASWTSQGLEGRRGNDKKRGPQINLEQ